MPVRATALPPASFGRPAYVSYPPPTALAEPRDLTYWAFAAQIWVLVLGQKLVIPAGPIPISLPFATLYAWLAFSVLRGELRIAPVRLGLLISLGVAALATQVLMNAPVSLPSLMLFLLLYFPLMFILPVGAQRYLQLTGSFQNVMVIGSVMVFLQLAWQAAFGLGHQPNLEHFVPARLLLDGYMYEAPIAWGQAFVRPNGFFFLEPSFASCFLASALTIELMFFHRPWRVVLYGAALLGTVAATGVLFMLIAAPFLLARQSLKTFAITVAAGLLGLAGAIYSGAVGQFLHRLEELTIPGSSGFARLIQPLNQLGHVYADPRVVFMGVGAGNSVERDVSLWPIAKVAIEYGAVAAVLFMALIIVSLLGSRNRPLAAALFVIFNFTGGFLLLPVTVIQILLLVCLMPPVHEEPAEVVVPPEPPPPQPLHPSELAGRFGVVVPLRPSI